jgi:hypothetical protein
MTTLCSTCYKLPKAAYCNEMLRLIPAFDWNIPGDEISYRLTNLANNYIQEGEAIVTLSGFIEIETKVMPNHPIKIEFFNESGAVLPFTIDEITYSCLDVTTIYVQN